MVKVNLKEKNLIIIPARKGFAETENNIKLKERGKRIYSTKWRKREERHCSRFKNR